MAKYLFLLISLLFGQEAYSQGRIAITIDDVPKTGAHGDHESSKSLLPTLDKLNIPVAIFINEGLLTEVDSAIADTSQLEVWIKRTYVIVGNHTYDHSRYSEVGYEHFTEDVRRGETITKQLIADHQKELNYFRFPYNDLGKTFAQHDSIEQFLHVRGYQIAPFTIESADWMFNDLYTHYLSQQNLEDAQRIANRYLEHTIKLVAYFEDMSQQEFGRPINHIYLCHDNQLNADYLDELVHRLRERQYSFISMDEAMTDPIYQTESSYHGKWGFSWIYRWIPDAKYRMQQMRAEPSIMDIIKEHKKVKG
jgi:peptidoglycan/xylan/chitin deacetylase (PgdA/CDA1 family)